jgi:hypothetical protein
MKGSTSSVMPLRALLVGDLGLESLNQVPMNNSAIVTATFPGPTAPPISDIITQHIPSSMNKRLELNMGVSPRGLEVKPGRYSSIQSLLWGLGVLVRKIPHWTTHFTMQ